MKQIKQENGKVCKKLYVIYILLILKKYSDFNHPLLQEEIIQYMNKDYGMNCNRKAVKDNIDALLEAGFDINQINNKGVYLIPEFMPGEIKILLDCILQSKSIQIDEAKYLIDKLLNLTDKGVGESLPSLSSQTFYHSDNQDFIVNQELIVEAIKNCKQIKFDLLDFGLDKKLHVLADSPCVVNPYHLIYGNNGFYYLVCTRKRQKEVIKVIDGKVVTMMKEYTYAARLRVDKLRDMKILAETREELPKVSSISDNFEEYCSNRPYAQIGKKKTIKVRINNDVVGNVIDFFGDFQVEEKGEKTSILTFNATVSDAWLWAVQRGSLVEILEPQAARNIIRSQANELFDKYLSTEKDRYEVAIKKAQETGCLKLLNLDLNNKRPLVYGRRRVLAAWFSNNQIQSFNFLQGFTRLKYLSLGRNDVEDISWLESLNLLEILHLSHTCINSIAILEQMDSLKALRLTKNPITDYSPLLAMKNLQILTVDKETALKIDILKLKSLRPEIEVYVDEGEVPIKIVLQRLRVLKNEQTKEV